MDDFTIVTLPNIIDTIKGAFDKGLVRSTMIWPPRHVANSFINKYVERSEKRLSSSIFTISLYSGTLSYQTKHVLYV